MRTVWSVVAWGILLGAVHGALAGMARLWPQGYVRAGLYRLWLVELAGDLLRSIAILSMVVAFAVVFWLMVWRAVRTVSAWLRIDPRTPWGCLLLLLVGSACWWTWWNARAFLGDLAAASWIRPAWDRLMTWYGDPVHPARWAVAGFVLGPVVVSVLRLRVRAANTPRWFDRAAVSSTVRRGGLVVVCALALLCVLLPLDRAWRSADRPNVVLITFDTVRADHLGCYGYARNTTPHIDALAKSGVLYAAAYAPSNWTAPSIGSMFTGLYPSEHGASIVDARLHDSPITLAEALRNAGYRTMAVISHAFVNRQVNFDQGFEYFDESAAVAFDESSSARVTAAALRMLDKHAREPFFLWVHYFDPHFDYLPHEGFTFGESYHGRLGESIAYELLKEIAAELTDGDVQHVRDVYDSEVAFTDDCAGKLLARLRSTGLDERTLIVFHADHGEEFREHGEFAHQNKLYQELVHVPLIIAGAVDSKLVGDRAPAEVSLISVPRTILNFCGVRSPVYPGPDLLAVAMGVEQPAAPVLMEGTQHRDFGKHKYAVVAGQAKVVWDRPDHDWEYYDLLRDPDEVENLATNGGAAPPAMQETLRSFAREMDAARGVEPEMADRDSPVQKLQAVGYAAPAATIGKNK